MICPELNNGASTLQCQRSNQSKKAKMADGGRIAEEGRTTRDFSDEESRQETDDEKLERQYFWKVIEAFLYYK